MADEDQDNMVNVDQDSYVQLDTGCYYYFNTLCHLGLVTDFGWANDAIGDEDYDGFLCGMVERYVYDLVHIWAKSGGHSFMSLREYLTKILDIPKDTK